MITVERLKELIKYEPETGNFVWAKGRPGASKGSVAGWTDVNNYRSIKIDRAVHLQHRLAFFYMNGRWPAYEMDHKDGDRTNNAWSNLREATRIQNAVNRKATAGLKGAEKQPNGKWIARIRHNKKKLYLGMFDTELQAHEAYMAKAREVHGEFARAS